MTRDQEGKEKRPRKTGSCLLAESYEGTKIAKKQTAKMLERLEVEGDLRRNIVGKNCGGGGGEKRRLNEKTDHRFHTLKGRQTGMGLPGRRGERGWLCFFLLGEVRKTSKERKRQKETVRGCHHRERG